MSKLNLLKNLTPEQAWQRYVAENLTVEMFMSNFYCDDITDIEKMCKIYARDVLNDMNTPYTERHLQYVAKPLTEYINNYIQFKGGIKNLWLYSEEELEEQFTQDVAELLKLIREGVKKNYV